MTHAISDMNHSGSAPSKSPEYNAAEIQPAAVAASDADVAGEDIDGVDLAALREHKRSIELDFLNEGYDVSSRAATGIQTDSNDEEEEMHMAANGDRFFTSSDAGGSDFSTSDSGNLAPVGSDVSGSETPYVSAVAHKYSTRGIRFNYSDYYVDYEVNTGSSDSSGSDVSGSQTPDAGPVAHKYSTRGIKFNYSDYYADYEVKTPSDTGSSDFSASDGSDSTASPGGCHFYHLRFPLSRRYFSMPDWADKIFISHLCSCYHC